MNKIKISELKTNETISKLIPEMTEKEYLDLKTNIEHEGIRHAIDINADNTILDGRHRVRACKSLDIKSIKFNRHDLSESEAIKFVRDTAIERRHLTKEQRLNIVLNSEDVIAEISERAKERQRESARLTTNERLGSSGPNREKAPTKRVNQEIAELAGVGRSTVVRAKKVKRENPEAYEKVIKGESTFNAEYEKLPTVKKSKPKKSEMNNETVTAPPKPKRDIREEMIEREANLSEEDRRKAHEGMTTENFKSYLENIRYTLQQMKDLGMNEEIKNSKEKLTKLLGEF